MCTPNKRPTLAAARRQRGDRPAVRIGRYAPSPTGGLHLGNLLAAFVADAWTRRGGEPARVKLRIEDLDTARCRPENTAAVLAELEAMGLPYEVGPHAPDAGAPYIQSQSGSRYRDALAALREKGRLFACECTRKELAVASAPHAGEDGPPYPGTCRDKGLPFNDPSKPVAWRFLPHDEDIAFVDAFCGPVEDNVLTTTGAFVVKRKDDVVAYHLAVVVDDAHQGVNEVVRGRDLLTSTARQIALQRALDLPTPAYAHGPLLVDETGDRLAKRRGDQTLSAMLQRHSPERIWGRIGAAFGLCEVGQECALEDLRVQTSRETFQPAQLRLPPDADFE